MSAPSRRAAASAPLSSVGVPSSSVQPDLEVPSTSTSSAPTSRADVPQTLFAPGTAFGGFGGVELAYSRIAGADVAQVCFEGAAILEHALSVGGAACAKESRVDGQTFGNAAHAPGDRLDFAYGGLAVRYHFSAEGKYNLAVGTLIGGGEVAITNRRGDNDGVWGKLGDVDRDAKTTDAVFVLEPRIGGCANLTRWPASRFSAATGRSRASTRGTSRPPI